MNNKISEKLAPLLSKINEKNIYYVLAGGFIFILIVDIFLIMGPQLASLNKINPKIKTLSDDIKSARENIQKLDGYTKENERLKINYQAISSKIKNKEEVPTILERISRLANKNGVKIDQIAPEPQNQKEMLKEKEKIYYSLPIVIEAKSDYHSFGRFLNQIENDDLFLIINNLTIASKNESRQHDIKFTLSAVVYELKR